MGSGNFGGFKNTKGSLKPEHLMEELRNSGVKFTEEDVVMIAKQKNDELLWLERGNKVAGLIHIEEGHSENLKSAFGVNKNSIPSFIKNVIEQGKIVSNVKKGKKLPEYMILVVNIMCYVHLEQMDLLFQFIQDRRLYEKIKTQVRFWGRSNMD